MVTANSSIEAMRVLFLVFTKELRVPLTSPALTLTPTATQNNFIE